MCEAGGKKGELGSTVQDEVLKAEVSRVIRKMGKHIGKQESDLLVHMPHSQAETLE